MNQSISDGGHCRTAPATSGLLKKYISTFLQWIVFKAPLRLVQARLSKASPHQQLFGSSELNVDLVSNIVDAFGCSAVGWLLPLPPVCQFCAALQLLKVGG